jgi:hypothetical protein
MACTETPLFLPYILLTICKSIRTRRVSGTVYWRAFCTIRLKYKIVRAIISVWIEIFTEYTRYPYWEINITNSLPEKNSHTRVQIYYSVLLLCFLIKFFPTFFKFPDPVNIKYFRLNQLIKCFHWVFSFSSTDKGNLFFPPWDQNKNGQIRYFLYAEQWFLHFFIISRSNTQNKMTSNRQKCRNFLV